MKEEEKEKGKEKEEEKKKKEGEKKQRESCFSKTIQKVMSACPKMRAVDESYA